MAAVRIFAGRKISRGVEARGGVGAIDAKYVFSVSQSILFGMCGVSQEFSQSVNTFRDVRPSIK